MEYEFKNNTLKFNRILSDLDKFVLKFVGILERQKIKYVIISGYVSILFGRSRATEDVDMYVEKFNFEKFKELSKVLEESGFWFINSDDEEELFGMLKDNLSVRIAEKDKVIPNIEMKFPKKDTDFLSLNQPLQVELNRNILLTSPLELQVAYKFLLGSEKDIEDALHIYNTFKEILDRKLMKELMKKLKVEDKAKKYKVI